MAVGSGREELGGTGGRRMAYSFFLFPVCIFSILCQMHILEE